MLKIKNHFLLFLLSMGLICSVTYITPANAANKCNAPQPTQVLTKVIQDLLTQLKNNRSRLHSMSFIRKLVDREVLPHVATETMARKILTYHWRKMDTNSRNEFVKEAKQLLIRTYAVAFKDFSDQKVILKNRKYLNKNKSIVKINSVLKSSNRNDMSINYFLIKTCNDWKIYDLSVNGVSIIRTYRAEFGEKIRKMGIKKLIAEIKKSNQN